MGKMLLSGDGDNQGQWDRNGIWEIQKWARNTEEDS